MIIPEATPAVTVTGELVNASLLAAAGLIVVGVPVLEAMPGWVTSKAVTVWLPEVLRTTLNVPVPPIKTALS